MFLLKDAKKCSGAWWARGTRHLIFKLLLIALILVICCWNDNWKSIVLRSRKRYPFYSRWSKKTLWNQEPLHIRVSSVDKASHICSEWAISFLWRKLSVTIDAQSTPNRLPFTNTYYDKWLWLQYGPEYNKYKYVCVHVWIRRQVHHGYSTTCRWRVLGFSASGVELKRSRVGSSARHEFSFCDKYRIKIVASLLRGNCSDK